jgi:N-acetylglucosaminyldiphosphoundecaprenol N-acetyl-beta-D-mannosaminyltransferase
MKTQIAGIKIDALSKKDAISEINKFLISENAHLITTIYSEFIVFAKQNLKFKQVLNNSDLALTDGIGIAWADYFLTQTKSKNKILAFCNLLASLFKTAINPKSVFKNIPEKISGSELVWDIVRLASENKNSICLYGGTNGVAKKTAEKLKERYSDIIINLAQSDKKFDEQAVNEIKQSKSDILLIAYSPPMQEIWLSDNLQNFGVKLAIGLGGTFDYIAGKRAYRPNFFNSRGLEWLWRLFTQPYRIKRMWNALPVFIWQIYKAKINQVK